MRASRRHILLLEDSKDVRSAFIALFEQSYEVHVAGSINQATGLVTRRAVDCAVIDVAQGAEAAIPTRNGYRVACCRYRCSNRYDQRCRWVDSRSAPIGSR